MLTEETVRALAVSYHAFTKCVDAYDANSDHAELRVWARLLLDDQRRTGVEMMQEDGLLYWIERPRVEEAA